MRARLDDGQALVRALGIVAAAVAQLAPGVGSDNAPGGGYSGPLARRRGKPAPDLQPRTWCSRRKQ